MDRRLLLTDEAIAQGALDAGLSGAYAYPGTPSTEIMEFIQSRAPAGVHREWSANEKTAFEEALGMSYAGKRALVAMKHVGLNVASDPFINSAITGVNGGLVVVAADDPSMHSSQNEQDSRFYADFALIPALEPSTQQEAYAITRHAFDLSEQMRLPVLLRISTRLAHSRADVAVDAPRGQNSLALPGDPRQFVLLPANARRNYAALLEKQAALRQASESSRFNVLMDGPDRSVGIIACGLAINYLREAFDGAPGPHPVLKVAQYPLPEGLLRRLAEGSRTLLVIEDGMPFVESRLRGVLPHGWTIRGRLDGTLPRAGELTPDSVARALGRPAPAARPAPALVVPRPPGLCAGCPHLDSFLFIKQAMAEFPGGRVFSDIGCYTLGALPPLEAIASCVDMGASITMAKGAADAGLRPAVAVIGDSTFTHSGMTGLLDAVYEKSPITLLILDNGTTGMTGGQVSLGSGHLEQIVLGLGVEARHLRVVTPLKKNHAANLAVLREELAHPGVSVILAQRACIQYAATGGPEVKCATI